MLSQTQQELSLITPDFDLGLLVKDVHQQSVRLRNILFEAGSGCGGMDALDGPVWANRSETSVDFVPGFHQVVGHTPINDFKTYDNESGSITYTDVLETQTRFYEVTIPN